MIRRIAATTSVTLTHSHTSEALNVITMNHLQTSESEFLLGRYNNPNNPSNPQRITTYNLQTSESLSYINASNIAQTLFKLM